MNEALYYSNGPVEWKYKQLGEVVKFEGGSQPPKKYFSNEKLSGMVRLIQIRDYKTNDFITYVPKELCRRFCNKDDIMIGRYGPPIFQILRGIEGAYNVALIKAIPQEDVIDKEYLYYFIKNEHLFKLIDGLSQRTSGQTGIDMEILKKYIIPIPTKEEQKKIASILSTVDEQIDNVEALIEKNKELKKGLIQTLLTKGIGHTKFKTTEIGEIPEEWEVNNLGNIVEVISGATPKTNINEYWDNGDIYWATPSDITSNGKYISVTEKKITENGLRNCSAKLLPIGSILMSSRATIGERCINTVPMTTNQGFKSLVCKDGINNEFIYYYVDILKEKLMGLASGSTFLEVSKKVVEDIKVVIPSLEEQEKIASILSEVDKKIDDYENKKQKLEELKKGLMQQLLTGNIRV